MPLLGEQQTDRRAGPVEFAADLIQSPRLRLRQGAAVRRGERQKRLVDFRDPFGNEVQLADVFRLSVLMPFAGADQGVDAGFGFRGEAWPVDLQKRAHPLRHLSPILQEVLIAGEDAPLAPAVRLRVEHMAQPEQQPVPCREPVALSQRGGDLQRIAQRDDRLRRDAVSVRKAQPERKEARDARILDEEDVTDRKLLAQQRFEIDIKAARGRRVEPVWVELGEIVPPGPGRLQQSVVEAPQAIRFPITLPVVG